MLYIGYTSPPKQQYNQEEAGKRDCKVEQKTPEGKLDLLIK
jgi:hypothetical protein